MRGRGVGPSCRRLLFGHSLAKVLLADLDRADFGCAGAVQSRRGACVRVLTISHMFPQPSDPIAGIFVLEQAKALRKLGIKVLVTSPIPWAPRLLSFMPRVRKYLRIPARSDVEGFTVDYL